MNIIDIIILICLIPAIIQGLRKGFISQAISFISIIVGVWASSRFTDLVGGWLAKYIAATEQEIKVIAFAIILIVTIVLLYMLGRLLEKVIKEVMLQWLNKLLGVTLAIIKYILLMGVIALIFDSLNSAFGLVNPNTMSGSVLYPIIGDIADIVFPYIKSLLTLN